MVENNWLIFQIYNRINACFVLKKYIFLGEPWWAAMCYSCMALPAKRTFIRLVNLCKPVKTGG